MKKAVMKKTNKISALKDKIQQEGLDGFIVPRGDEYLGEFVPESAERLAWLTGFTGSAGTAVIGLERSAIFTDGRYDIQIRQQVSDQDFEIHNITKTKIEDWVQEAFPDHATIGYDPMLHTPSQIKKLSDGGKNKSISFKAVRSNLVDSIWTNQPAPPENPVVPFPEDIAGQTSSEKRQAISKALNSRGCLGTLIAQPDSIAWLLNIRGSDIPHNPFALSRGFLYSDGSFDWFIDPDRVAQSICDRLGEDIRIFSPAQMPDRLKHIAKKANKNKESVLLDDQRCPVYFLNLFEDSQCNVTTGEDPCLLPRARKTNAETRAMRNVHIEDGAAVVRFLKWLDERPSDGTVSELEAAQRIDILRANIPGFYDTSFDTISGFGPNGAIVHYRVTEKTNKQIKEPGLLLIDSGGQYLGEKVAGTTDITRTIPVGEVEQRIKRHFTRVLKGHIRLATARFPEGTDGSQLDSFARESLWEAGLDYMHGTGHGVGCFLSVHEEAATLSPRGSRSVEPGMILSNEPGYYEAGSHGIRIENLVLTKQSGEKLPDGRALLEFETLSLAPIDSRLIVTEMLTPDEQEWLNSYHKHVFETLSPLLSPDEKNWLRKMCAAV